MRSPYVGINVHTGSTRRRPGAADLVESIRLEIDDGRLHAGARLPPVRVLEHQLGISKNTVQAAYDELCARGLLVSRPREGVFVAPPDPTFDFDADSRVTWRPAPPRLKPAHTLAGWPGPNLLHLSAVFIDPELCPHDRLAECLRSVAQAPLRPFYDAQGHLPLREAIAKRMCARGLDVTPDEVIITNGSQQALDLVARSMLTQTVALENPVYAHVKLLFEHLGYRTHALRLDPFERVDLDSWEDTLRTARPSLVYAITSFQNPTGYSYSSHELTRLLDLSEELGFALLEDDWGSDMLSGTEYRPTLRAMGGKHVLYANSFTKKLLPSLRLGFLVASPDAVPSLLSAKRVSTLGNAVMLEAALAEFLERGYFDTHLSRVQAALDTRYQACLDTLRETMPEEVRFTTPGGGPTLWLELPERVDLGALRAKMAERGVYIEDTRNHFHGAPHLNGFRLSYAFLSTEKLRIGIYRLADALRDMGLG